MEELDLPPRLRSYDLPDGEKALLGEFTRSLMTIASLYSDLRAAVELNRFSMQQVTQAEEQRMELRLKVHEKGASGDFAREERVLSWEHAAVSRYYCAWTSIANRDASITLANFRMAIKIAADQSAQECELTSRIERAKIDEALARFDDSFPGAVDLRDHVAHRAESGSTRINRKRRKQNALKESFRDRGLNLSPGNFVSQGFSDGTMMASHRGKMQKQTLDEEFLKSVRSIRDTVFGAFIKATVDFARPSMPPSA